MTSVFTGAGGEGNLLDPTPECCHQIALDLPIVNNDQMARLKLLSGWRGFTSVTLPMLFVAEGAHGMEKASNPSLKERAAIDQGTSLIILSDRGCSPGWRPFRRSWRAPGCTITSSAGAGLGRGS